MADFTFSYIKPAAVLSDNTGSILKLIEESGFKIIALKKTQLTLEQAEQFYAVHKGRPFFERLMKHTTSGPVVAMILEKDGAVEDLRALIGATDPEDAEEGTIRKLYGQTVTANAVHGSDSSENAEKESSFFFSNLERF